MNAAVAMPFDWRASPQGLGSLLLSGAICECLAWALLHFGRGGGLRGGLQRPIRGRGRRSFHYGGRALGWSNGWYLGQQKQMEQQ